MKKKAFYKDNIIYLGRGNMTQHMLLLEFLQGEAYYMLRGAITSILYQGFHIQEFRYFGSEWNFAPEVAFKNAVGYINANS